MWPNTSTNNNMGGQETFNLDSLKLNDDSNPSYPSQQGMPIGGSSQSAGIGTRVAELRRLGA